MIESGNGRSRTMSFKEPPKRVVSLVPSMTESLFDLGFGESVVGITDYCTQPEQEVQNLPRLGGPKNPDVAAIIKMHPDLVIANQEENPSKVVEALEREGIKVWVSFPRSVREAMDVLWALAGIYQSRQAAAKIESLQMLFGWVEAASQDRSPLTYFCPIWQDITSAGFRWWMTFNDQTYAASVLNLVGGKNAFGARQRHYPLDADLGLADPVDSGEHDTRYPRLTLDEIKSTRPDVILLPSEPFAFCENHLQEISSLLADTPAIANGRIHLVDGSLITWHGTRLAKALQELPGYFNS